MVFVFRWQDDNKMMFRRGRWTAVPAGDGRRRQRRFATMEAAEGAGGGGSSVDVLDFRFMCGSDFP